MRTVRHWLLSESTGLLDLARASDKGPLCLSLSRSVCVLSQKGRRGDALSVRSVDSSQPKHWLSHVPLLGLYTPPQWIGHERTHTVKFTTLFVRGYNVKWRSAYCYSVPSRFGKFSCAWMSQSLSQLVARNDPIVELSKLRERSDWRYGVSPRNARKTHVRSTNAHTPRVQINHYYRRGIPPFVSHYPAAHSVDPVLFIRRNRQA